MNNKKLSRLLEPNLKLYFLVMADRATKSGARAFCSISTI